MRGLPLFLIAAGSLLLLYGLWGLYSGWIISTWARVEYRSSAHYWITVIALVVIGSVNLAIGVASLVRR